MPAAPGLALNERQTCQDMRARVCLERHHSGYDIYELDLNCAPWAVRAMQGGNIAQRLKNQSDVSIRSPGDMRGPNWVTARGTSDIKTPPAAGKLQTTSAAPSKVNAMRMQSENLIGSRVLEQDGALGQALLHRDIAADDAEAIMVLARVHL